MIEPDSNAHTDLTELLAGDALGELDTHELQTLSESTMENDKQNAEELRATVAALQLAFMGQELMPMPSSLRDKIASDAPKYLAGSVSSTPVQPLVEQVPATSVSRREQLAWLVTAASLLVAVGCGYRTSNRRSQQQLP